MDKTIRRLPDAELEVMQAVWACEAPAARADIDAKLKDTHPMALTTLLTVLTRLADKGFLRIEKQGRSARYIPLVLSLRVKGVLHVLVPMDRPAEAPAHEQGEQPAHKQFRAHSSVSYTHLTLPTTERV